MNQTEIPYIRKNNQNNNTLNVDSSTSRNKTITIRTGDNHRRGLNSPIESQQQNNQIVSQSKLVRISSSKGIRVMSRQSSTEKHTPSEFKIRNSQTQIMQNNSLKCPQSETSIQLDQKQQAKTINRKIQVMTLPEYLQQKMRKQLIQATQKHQSKINQQLSLQYNTFNIELEKLKELLSINECKLSGKQNEVFLLKEKVELVESNLFKNIIKVQDKIQNFVGYYQQCNKYTLKRISQLEIKFSILFQQISKQFNPMDKVQTWQKLEKGYTQIKRIAINLGANTSAFKISTDDDLFQLQKTLGSAVQKLQQLECERLEMKNIDFGNQGFQCSIQQMKSIYNRTFLSCHPSNSKDTNSSLLELFDPKFKQITKKLNSLAIQIELSKNLWQNCENTEGELQKVKQLQKAITDMKNNERKLFEKHEQKIKEMRTLMISNEEYQQKIQIIQNLQQIMKQKQSTQMNLREQIKSINKKISYYQIKIQRSSDLEINLQTSLAEAYSESLLKQRIKIVEDTKNQQISNLQRLITDHQSHIKNLDHQNYLLAQKLSSSQQSSTYKALTKKMESQLNYQREANKKTILEYHAKQQQNTKYKIQINQLTSQNKLFRIEVEKYIEEVKNIKRIMKQKQNSENRFKVEIQELKKENNQLKKKVQELISENANKIQQKSQEKEQYQDSQNLVNKYSKEQLLEHIQILEEELEIFQEKNTKLSNDNNRLEESLHQYAQTFQKQSLTFRAAIQSLQQEKNKLLRGVRSLEQANNSLRSGSSEYNSGTMQSFYEQKTQQMPNNSVQLKKTCSTQLSGQTQNNRNYNSQAEFRKSSVNLNLAMDTNKKYRKNQQSMKQLPKKCLFMDQPVATSNNNKKLDKVSLLKNQFINMGYQMPVHCEIDATGNLKCEKTGIYFIDQDDNLFELSQTELQYAVSLGIILL